MIDHADFPDQSEINWAKREILFHFFWDDHQGFSIKSNKIKFFKKILNLDHFLPLIQSLTLTSTGNIRKLKKMES